MLDRHAWAEEWERRWRRKSVRGIRSERGMWKRTNAKGLRRARE